MLQEYTKFYEYERKYCKNIESIINIAESIFVRFGARVKCSAIHMNLFENCRSVVMIKSFKPGMQITASEETTPNQFVFRDALNTCLE